MRTQIKYWKTLALNMLTAGQALFVVNTVWDFFLTVVVPNSIRSHIFANISSVASVFIVLPWLLGIFALTILLFGSLVNGQSELITHRINVEYGAMMLVYIALFGVACFNPAIAWPIMLNYVVNIVWACTLICFRRAIQDGIVLLEDLPEDPEED